MAKKKRPRDINRLARQVVEEATGQAPMAAGECSKDPAAVALGRKGGLKGGPARAAKLTKEQLRESARKASATRWAKSGKAKQQPES